MVKFPANSVVYVAACFHLFTVVMFLRLNLMLDPFSIPWIPKCFTMRIKMSVHGIFVRTLLLKRCISIGVTTCGIK